MKNHTLGEFEEIVLLVTASLQEEGYAVTITMAIEEQTGRSVGFNTVHTTLQRLQEKGFVNSKMGGATAERGGRRKRFFRVSTLGFHVLNSVRGIREKLWGNVPVKVAGVSRS